MGKRRILMVEDEAGLTDLLKRSLEQTGQYEVLSVPAEQDAVEAARRFRPDLVLLDVMLSGPVQLGDLMQQLDEHLAEASRE